jgi:hypothetical protein
MVTWEWRARHRRASLGAVLEREQIERALGLSAMGHEFMKWLGDNTRAPGVAFDHLHDAMSVPEAARSWVDRHYDVLPRRCRPEREDLASFANLVGTYLETSFQLVPGRRRLETDCGCLCRCCAAFADMSSLKTRTLSRHDKADAAKLMWRYAFDRARELGRSPDDSTLDHVVANPALREPLAMAAWARELLRRLDGIAEGPSVLALWRMFAWLPTGSPKPHFKITTDAVIAADAAIAAALR